MFTDILQFLGKAIPFLPLLWGAFLVVIGVMKEKKQSLYAGAAGVLIYFLSTLAISVTTTVSLPIFQFMSDTAVLYCLTFFNLILIYSLKTRDTKLIPGTGLCVAILLLIAFF